MNRLTNRSPKNVDLCVLCVCVFFFSNPGIKPFEICICALSRDCRR